MIAITLVLLLSFNVAADDSAPPAGPPTEAPAKVEAPSPPADADKPSPTTPKKGLRKKGDKPDVKPEEKPKDPGEEDAPAVDSDRPIPNPDQPEEKKETDEKLDRELGKDLEASKNDDTDPLNRLTDEMRRAEELLAKADGSDETVGVQEQIVKDLELLLKQAQQPPPSNSSQSKSKKKKQQQQQQQMGQQQQRQKQASQQRQNDRANNSSDRIGPPRSSKPESSPQPEERDVWGHLSEMMRGEMSQYAKENFLTKYRDMIERYYTDIARRSQQGTGP